jgi:hypothetical protein
MDRTVDWTLLAKYLSGECTEEEEDAIKERIQRDPSMRSSLKEAERIWDASRAPSELRDWNVELLWDRVKEGTLGSAETENREAGDPRDQDHGWTFLTSTLKEEFWSRTRQSSTWAVGVSVFGFSALVALLFFCVSGTEWCAGYEA